MLRSEWVKLRTVRSTTWSLLLFVGISILRRLFGGGAAIIFKGSGFYETDYRRKDEEKKSGKPAEAAESKPAETKTESSPAVAESNGDGGSKKKTGKAKKADG